MPFLDYIAGTDQDSDPEFPVTENHLERLLGSFAFVLQQGPYALGKKHLTIFRDKGYEGLCEFRVVAKEGHRFFGVLDSRRVVLTSAIRKPNQRETPRAAMNRARSIFREHQRRSGAA
jgi:hypothetical protein